MKAADAADTVFRIKYKIDMIRGLRAYFLPLQIMMQIELSGFEELKSAAWVLRNKYMWINSVYYIVSLDPLCNCDQRRN